MTVADDVRLNMIPYPYDLPGVGPYISEERWKKSIRADDGSSEEILGRLEKKYGSRRMSIVRFTIPGNPVPQSRPRVSRYGTYYPPKVKAYREYVATIAKAAMRGREPMQGALEMYCTFRFTPPKSTPKKALSKLYGTYYTGKKDIDNLVKSIADSCIGICYVDDSQIAVLNARKYYADKPRAEIVIVER